MHPIVPLDDLRGARAGEAVGRESPERVLVQGENGAQHWPKLLAAARPRAHWTDNPDSLAMTGPWRRGRVVMWNEEH